MAFQVVHKMFKEGLRVFTDGAAVGNGKSYAIGGIGVWFSPNSAWNISEGYSNSSKFKVTNQTMEMVAAIRALQVVQSQKGRGVVLYTDSMYMINCVTKWYKQWQRNGWRTASGKAVLNREIIEILVKLTDATQCTLKHIRSHQREPAKPSLAYDLWYGNMMADELASQGMQAIKQSK